MVHLGKDSKLIKQHHTNWRLKSIESLDKRTEQDLRYSALISLSKKDAFKIKESILANFQENLEVIGDSKEEVAYVYNFDFFEF